MVAVSESEINIGSEQTEFSGEIQIVPNQRMTVLYRNGTGEMIEEEIIAPLEESKLYNLISGRLFGLRRELSSIIGRRGGVPRRRKRGRPLPKREQTELIRRFNKQERGIRDKIDRQERIVDRLGECIKASDPLSPLRLEVEESRVSILDGECMTEVDQKWWQFMRGEAPRIWDFFREGKKDYYKILHELFVARVELNKARGFADREQEEKSEKKLTEVSSEVDNMLDKMPSSDYLVVKSLVKGVTEYTTRSFLAF